MDSLQKLIAPLEKIAPLKKGEDCRPYDTDWTKAEGAAELVACPRSSNEVAAILKLCNENKIPVVPSGGRTGLAAGATATKGALVLSLEKLNRAEAVDLTSLTVRVQAGMTNHELQEHCAPFGLTWPIDLGSRGSCQVGGNLSTNAGGLHVIRYGMARRWVTGLQAVLMDGTILDLNHGLEKNNTGYDLLQLIVGSEGTLAVITEATLKLVPIAKKRAVLFFSVASLEALRQLLTSGRKAGLCLHAFEFFSEKCRKTVSDLLGHRSPLSTVGEYYSLVEIDSAITSMESIEAWLSKVMEEKWVTDGLLARSSTEEQAIWKMRESITESLQKWAPVRKYDVSVPVAKSVEFLREAEKLCAQPKYPFDLFLFGHLGDGSPHLNLVRKEKVSVDSFLKSCEAFEQELYPLLLTFHGSASAEHGVGLLKKSWVKFSRTPEELQLFKAIKKTFDPKGLLNPEKLIP